MLGFGRRPGDRGVAALRSIGRWFWMEFFSDPYEKSAGIMPALDLPPPGGAWVTFRRRDDGSNRVGYGGGKKPYPWGVFAGIKEIWSGLQIPQMDVVSDLDSSCLGFKSWLKRGCRSHALLGLNIQSSCGARRICRQVAALQSMESSSDGGDKGIIIGMITHPKSLDPVMEDRLQTHVQNPILAEGAQHEDTSVRADGYVREPQSVQGPAGYTEGEVVEEEDDAVEVEIEEDEIQKVSQWTILARFYSLRFPNVVALFEDMRRAWRLRADMSYKSLKDNLLIITFSAEGDYNFVMQGGPWLHRGDALVIAQFDGLTNPSMVPLETVPIWVRIYDLPLVMMNKTRGELYGNKLGRVREVDVDEDGRNKHDFFCIRVDLPINRPLKTHLAIKIKTQGKEELRKFNLRYERVPHFCFLCGFIGHSDKECAKKLPGDDASTLFSTELRCSPLKPYERKVSRVKAAPSGGVPRKIIFRGAGSSSSSSKGGKQGDFRSAESPARIDAFDGFETKEGEGDAGVDAQLAEQTNLMRVSDMNSRQQNPANADQGLSGILVQSGSGSGRGDLLPIPSTEMISAIRNLSSYQDSMEEGSLEETTSPNKRKNASTAEGKKKGKVQQALLEYKQLEEASAQSQDLTGAIGRVPKRVRKEGATAGKGSVLEATGLGAASSLAGPTTGSRQGQ